MKARRKVMKTNAKRLKAIGRKYAKQAFRLTEDDFVELSMLERAYLNGYKRCLKELKDIDKDGYVLVNPITSSTLDIIGKFLKDNIVDVLHEDIDKAVTNEDYEELLKYMKAVEYTLTNFKKKLEIAILEK